MIVDLHTRVWESTDQLGDAIAQQMRRRRIEPWMRPAASIEDHRHAMAPVANAVVLGFQSQMLGAAITHEQVARYVATDPKKYIGFAGIDPTTGNAMRSLQEAIDLGLAGVTICPAAAGFHPTDTRAMAIYEACADRGMPVLIENGTLLAREARMEFAQPHLLDEAARTFPDLRLILGAFADPWINEALTLIAKHPTVFADLSGLLTRPWHLFNALVMAHQRGVINQVLFGSDFPHCNPERAIMTIYSVNTMSQGTTLPTVPREQLRSIIERDALTTLGLDAPALTLTDAGPAPVLTDSNGPAAGDANPTPQLDVPNASAPVSPDKESDDSEDSDEAEAPQSRRGARATAARDRDG